MNEQVKLATPLKRISPRYQFVLRLSELISTIIILAIIGGFYALANYFHWGKWSLYVVMITGSLTILYAVWSIIFQPFFFYKNFRYEIDDTFLQTTRGAWFFNYHLVPMTKIQSVGMSEGPILRMKGLATITIETMGSAHAIPGLPKDVAIQLREEIGHLAKLKEVD